MRIIYVLAILCLLMAGCRKDEVIVPTEYDILPEYPAPGSRVRGFYLLNEGNMGSNKCTVDYMDYSTGMYARNFYGERNPHVVKELGDVGNDVGVYGGKVYIVVNCSHKVEVMDARTGVRLGQIDISNCRYVRFHDGRAYVSAYVAPVEVNPDAPRGIVAEIDTSTLAIRRTVTVGYQPEEFDFAGGKMYVANSGGYRKPRYDRTVSVVDLASFKVVGSIDVAINLHRLRMDAYGNMWVTSRGDNGTIPSELFVVRHGPDGEYSVVRPMGVPCTNLAIYGETMYYFANDIDEVAGTSRVTYGMLNVKTQEVIEGGFIRDGSEKDIKRPYALAVHPETGEVLISDAKNYVSSGMLHCYTREGKRKWSVRTGDIPAAVGFVKE